VLGSRIGKREGVARRRDPSSRTEKPKRIKKGQERRSDKPTAKGKGTRVVFVVDRVKLGMRGVFRGANNCPR